MVMFSKFPKKLCSGLMYAFVIYTLQMILNGGGRGHQGSNAALWPRQCAIRNCNRVELA